MSQKERKDKGRPREAKRSVCGAQKGNGDICLAFAGSGTDHTGFGRCQFHGGKSPSGQTFAAGQEANALSRLIEVSPAQAVSGVMFSAAGEMAYATAKSMELTEDEVMTPKGYLHHWIRFKHVAEERLVRFAKVAVDIGIVERQTKLQEVQTAMMANLLTRVLDELDLTAKQRAKVGPAIRKNMAVFDGGARPLDTGRAQLSGGRT